MSEQTTPDGIHPDERLRELSGSGWLFRFMEEFPQVRRLRAGGRSDRSRMSPCC